MVSGPVVSCGCVRVQVKPLLQVTRQEEEMGQKEEELKAARETAAKAEAELEDVSQQRHQVTNPLPVSVVLKTN